MPNTSQAQIWTRKRFGYGLYVVTAMGDTQALNHAWYLQNKQPAAPQFASQWAWIEFDWELVPQTTSATPLNRIVGQGSSLPFTSVDAYRVEMANFDGAPGALSEVAGQRTDESYAGSILTNQWAWGVEHGTLGYDWPAIPSSLASQWSWLVSQLYLRPANVETDAANLWSTDFTAFTQSTIGWGYPYFPVTSNAGIAVPTYIIGAPPNPLAMAWPAPSALADAISINVINAPLGTTPLIGYDFQSSTYLAPASPTALFVPVSFGGPTIQYQDIPVPQSLWQFFYASSGGSMSPGQAFPGRQSFVYAAEPSAYQPTSAFYDYTIAWTPTRVAFYILPAGQGANIDGATPVYVMDLADNPTVANFGPAFPGATDTFWYQSYAGAEELGNVFLSFQLWNMGPNSFSGTQSGDGAMYVRKAAIYTWTSGDGSARADFSTAAALAFDATAFTSNAACIESLTQSFSILNGAPSALYYNADNVSWVSTTPADQSPALELASVFDDGSTAEWYLLGPAGWTGAVDLSQQVVAQITPDSLGAGQGLTYACASSGEDADWIQVTGATSTSPVNGWLTIKNPAGGYEARAQISFSSDSGASSPSWSIGTPAPTNTQTTQAIAEALFAGLSGQGSGQGISPQLFTGS